MNVRGLFLAGACLGAAITTAVSAQADTTDDLLQQLRTKGILTDQEYRALSQRKAEEDARRVEAARTPAVPPATATALDSTVVRTTDKGVGLKIGAVELKLSGSVNGFYVHDSGDDPGPTKTVTGGVINVGGDTSSVRNGLLPGFLKFDVTTTQDGWDVGAHFGMYPGIDSVSWGEGGANSSGNPTALATSGIDFRQTYLTFGKPQLGEVKIGRDIGLFASEAILTDITLLSIGTAAGNAAPSNTSLGRIGVGYIYTDFQPQITYTSPSFAGVQLAVGVFQPLRTAGTDEENSQPGFQGEITYALKAGAVTGKLWASAITQKHDATGGLDSYRGSGIDVGGSVTLGDASLAGYYYTGEGIGTTGLFILATDAAGNKRDSDGFYVQGTYTLLRKLTLGASYGESRLDLTGGEINPTLVKVNKSWVGQVKYGLTDWVSLIGEYINTTAKAHGGNKAESDTIALGAILFF
ncbi:porin [Oleisolibacter albus]|uniref:porin n=1 Tax=Oleisolibacter albus TaxID=2171757 RepID=UPI000DF1CF32|nr:porin [Oleisolibacter albus]